MMKLSSALVMVFIVCGAHSVAHAGRGLMIINTGEDVIEISDIKAEARAEVEQASQPGVKVGLSYSRFGVFWLDLWRWDQKFVLFAGDTVYTVPEAEIAALSAGPLRKPFTMTLPPGLIVLLVAGAAFGGLALLSRNKKTESPDSTPATEDE